MHIVGINFITFTAQLYIALHVQGKKGDFCHLGGYGPGPFGPLNPPMMLGAAGKLKRVQKV